MRRKQAGAQSNEAKIGSLDDNSMRESVTAPRNKLIPLEQKVQKGSISPHVDKIKHI